MRPASAAFALLLDLIVVLARPLLFCVVLEFKKEPEEVVALAAEAISLVLARSHRRLRGELKSTDQPVKLRTQGSCAR